MISPSDVHDLPPGSVVMASAWAAVRLPQEPRRFRFWQVTGKVARISDAELSALVARTQELGDAHVVIARLGSVVPGVPADDLDLIREELSSLIDETLTGLTYGQSLTIARNTEDAHRRRFGRLYPRLQHLMQSTPTKGPTT